MAAETAIIDYNTEDLEPPILTVEQAVERSSFFEVPSMLYPSQVGDFAKGMAEADHQIHSEVFNSKPIKMCRGYFSFLSPFDNF